MKACQEACQVFSRRLTRFLGLATVMLFGSVTAAEDFKVGFVYVGPVGDHGWTYQHDQGRLAVEKELGVETTYVELVPEGAEAERVIRQLADSGHKIIFTTSFGYMDPTLKVAEQFPEVKFEHATGFKRAKNMATYSARFYEGRHVAGLIAGHMTKSNVLGYVAAYPIPEVVRGINAVLLAARKVNPEVSVRVVWVNSWFDPGKEADAAKVLIDQGADVIFQHTDSPAPVQVAEKRGVYAIGQASDMSAFGGRAHLTAIIDNWSPYYISRVKRAQAGSWQSKDTWEGFAKGMVEMSPYNRAIPKKVIDEAEAARKAIINNSLHPFAGPIVRQDGVEVVPAGRTAPDQMLLSMDFFVEGVVGSVP